MGIDWNANDELQIGSELLKYGMETQGLKSFDVVSVLVCKSCIKGYQLFGRDVKNNWSGFTINQNVVSANIYEILQINLGTVWESYIINNWSQHITTFGCRAFRYMQRRYCRLPEEERRWKAKTNASHVFYMRSRLSARGCAGVPHTLFPCR